VAQLPIAIGAFLDALASWNPASATSPEDLSSAGHPFEVDQISAHVKRSVQVRYSTSWSANWSTNWSTKWSTN
jgi:hypothetical protein